MNKYEVTLKHDSGTITIKTTASNKEKAIQQVLNIELAPLSAVIDCQKKD